MVPETMDVSRVMRIREDMERAEARRLQPHYVESFFLEAFKQLGGNLPAEGKPTIRGYACPIVGPFERSDYLVLASPSFLNMNESSLTNH